MLCAACTLHYSSAAALRFWLLIAYRFEARLAREVARELGDEPERVAAVLERGVVVPDSAIDVGSTVAA
jgi:hypothetical protein